MVFRDIKTIYISETAIASYFNELVGTNVGTTFYDQACWFRRMKDMWIKTWREEAKEQNKALKVFVDDEGRVLRPSKVGHPGGDFVKWCKAQLESEGRKLTVAAGLKNDTSLNVSATIALSLAPVTVSYVTELHNTNVSHLFIYQNCQWIWLISNRTL